MVHPEGNKYVPAFGTLESVVGSKHELQELWIFRSEEVFNGLAPSNDSAYGVYVQEIPYTASWCGDRSLDKQITNAWGASALERRTIDPGVVIGLRDHAQGHGPHDRYVHIPDRICRAVGRHWFCE